MNILENCIFFVEARGIEPLLEEPKSSVLPLDDASIDKSIQVYVKQLIAKWINESITIQKQY